MKISLENCKKFINKHSPEILTGIGIIGMATSVVTAVKATPEALKLLDKERQTRYPEVNGNGYDKNGEISIIDSVKIAWKPYIPASISFVLSTACIIGGNRISARRNAALGAAYAIVSDNIKNYKRKVIETIGEKKEKEIEQKVAQDNVNKNNPDKNQIIITQKGNTLVRDTVSGRYFRSDMDAIKKVINEMNRRLTFEHYISLNEFYENMNLDTVKNGWDIGWNLDDGLIEPIFSTCISPDDEPCLVLDYSVAPRYEYSKLM